MKIHPKDYEKATSTDHHGDETAKEEAKQFARDNGHHDGLFLHKLATKFKGE
jgi:hypothetical protein